MKKQTFIPRLYLRYKKGPDLNLSPIQSIICSYAPPVNDNKLFKQGKIDWRTDSYKIQGKYMAAEFRFVVLLSRLT